MKQRKVRKGGDWYLFFLPMLQGLGIWSLVIGAILGFTNILFHADKLGWFFVPVLVAYFSAIAAVAGWFFSRKARNYLHMMMGDELFYKTYAFDRWLLQRRQRKQARKREEQAEG